MDEGNIRIDVLLLLMHIVGVWRTIPNGIGIIIHLLAVHLIMLCLRMSGRMMMEILRIILAVAHARLWVVGIGLGWLCGVAYFLVRK